ncbi:uncharacterized protein [Gossypium hirsutum]|uniref:Uncharacterized protein n=1 Tax=Gossypium hirsutum TaxID=3635 RepID=A0ABM2YMY9_GOSHI|nr:uncharacterized protein LOC121205029 [Gossypium hirsutum]
MAITEEENEGRPPGFTLPHVPLQTEGPPRRPSVTVRPQHGPVDAGILVNFPSGLGNNLGDSPINLITLDLDLMEKERIAIESSKQLEDRCKLLEEKFRVLEGADRITMLFINILMASFITHMIGSTTKSFVDTVIAGEMIENAIRGGKIKGETAKRSAPRRKDNEVNNMNSLNSRTITVGQPKAASVEQQSTQRQESGTRQNSKRMQFTPIPMTYHELYQSLYDAHAIAPFHLKPLQRPYPKCTPNAENLLPDHGNQGVNAIDETREGRIKEDVAKVKTPMKVIWEEMVKRGMLTSGNGREIMGNYCEFHGEGSSCKRKICVLENERQGTSRSRIIISLPGNNKVGAQIGPKIVIHKPNPFPYKDDKSVPWSYDCSVTVPKGESIASASRGMQNEGSHTRSGKRYDTGGVRVEPTKTKGVEVEKEKETEVPVNEPVKEEEAKEFLKFLRHSEYSMVEQLRKQLARISVLALLLNSEVYWDVLLKVLNETYVTHDISVNKLDRLVNNISADNFIYFNDDEIPPRGIGSTKALHITTRCKGYTLPSVLIDNGSALNVLPLFTLNRLPIDSSHMKTCHNVVRAFDGTERKVMGRIDIPLEIGPNTYKVDFLEDIIAAVTSKAPYVETNEEAIECSFHSLEIINATFILEGSEVLVPKMSRAIRMALQMIMGRDYCQEKD